MLDKEKRQFSVNKILLLRYKLMAEGIRPDKEKVNAILKMQLTTDKTGALHIMVLIDVIGKVIPNLCKIVYL